MSRGSGGWGWGGFNSFPPASVGEGTLAPSSLNSGHFLFDREKLPFVKNLVAK